MKAVIVSLFNAGLCHAGGFCKALYPSYTAVYMSPSDFKDAKIKGASPITLRDGVFQVDRNRKAKKSVGTVESGVITAAFWFDRLVLSANAYLPPLSAMLAEAQVGLADKNGEILWSKWYKLGRFSTESASSSFGPQTDDFGSVRTDVLTLNKPVLFYRYRITLETESMATPVLRLAAVNISDSRAKYNPETALKSLAEIFPAKPRWLNPDRVLEVPARSQMNEKVDPDSICSPVSLGMGLAYYGTDLTNTSIANQVYDTAENIYGNWFINTAFAGSKALFSFVDRFNSMADAERSIALSYPLIASITYEDGELKNAPVPASAGHLVVIRGFDSEGNVRVNDPAAKTEKTVPRWYLRDQFAKAWLGNKQGLVYRLENRYPRIMRAAVPVADVHNQPDPQSGLETQVFLNEAVLVKSFKNGWAEVESLEQGFYNSPACSETISSCWQGYPGWIKEDALVWGEDYGYAYTVKTPRATALLETPEGFEDVKLVMGTRLCPAPVYKKKDGYLRVMLSGMRPGWVKTEDVAPYTDGKKTDPRSGVVQLAREFEGTDYLWGGRTADGMDCSGLVSLVNRLYGVNLPRNAGAQFEASKKVFSVFLKKGDLVFLSKKENPDVIEHVLLYAGDEDIIEANREKGSVVETTFKKRFGKKLEDIRQGEKINGNFIYFRTLFEK